VAIGKVLSQKIAYVEARRAKLTKQADRQAEEARARYLRLVDELAEAREDLRGYRRAAVWARLYPTEQAGAEPPDSFPGARKRALAPLGIGAPVAPERVLRGAARRRRLAGLGRHARAARGDSGHRPAPAAGHGLVRRPEGEGQAQQTDERTGQQPMTTDQVERYHRRPKRDKAIDPPLRRRCSHPRCPTLREAEPDGPFCLYCRQRVRDRADQLRARNERKAT
jgi:hypothetical protein